MNIYFALWSVFFKIGSFTFGGGYAMLPLIEREVVTKKAWVTGDEILDLFAVGQSIPGAIAINTATLIGYKVAGKRGAVCATLGVIMPSFLIISVVASFFVHIADLELVKAVFTGIGGAVVVLIAMAAFKMMKSATKDRLSLIIFLVVAFLGVLTPISPIVFIAGGGLLGLSHYFIQKKRGQDYDLP